MTPGKILPLEFKLRSAATRSLIIQSRKLMGSRRGTLTGRKKSISSFQHRPFKIASSRTSVLKLSHYSGPSKIS